MNARSRLCMLLACLLLAVPSPVMVGQATAASFSPGLPTSTITTGGADPRVAILGSTMIVAHRIASSGLIVVDISQDAGTTWITRSTTLTGIVNPQPIIMSSTVFLVFGSNEAHTCKDTLPLAKSTDGGITWTIQSIPTGIPYSCATWCGTNCWYLVADRIATARLGNRVFLAYNIDANANISPNPSCQIIVKYTEDNGATWTTTTAASATCGQPGGTTGYCGYGSITKPRLGTHGLSLHVSSLTEWNVMYTTGTSTTPSGSACPFAFDSNEALAEVKTINMGAAYASTGPVNDVFTPLSAPFGSRVMYAAGSRDLITFTDRVTPGKIWAAERRDDGWYVHQFPGTSNLGTIPQAFRCGSKQFVAYTGATGTDQVTLQSNTPGTAWTPYAVTGSLTTGNPTRASLTAISSKLHVVAATTTAPGPVYDYAAALCPADVAVGPAPALTQAVTGLIGFDVDPFNQNIITRRTNPSGGQDIQTQNPTNLHVTGTFHETGCNRIGGIATRYANGRVFTSFLDCDANNNVNVIRVRDQNLGPPDLSGTPCAGETFCDTDITGPFAATGTDAPPTQARDIGGIEAAPWDYTVGSTEPDCALCVKHVTLAWAYTEVSGGHVGIYAITLNKGAQDAAATATQVYAPAGTVLNDFCAWRDTVSKKDYLAAVHQGGATKVYQVSVTEQASGIRHVPIVSLTPVFLGNGGFDNAVSLGCARDRILALTSDGRAVLATVTGRILATFPAPAPMMQSAAMSLDGSFGVYGSQGNYHIVNLVNMTEVLQVPVPSGSLYTTSLDFNAKTLWSATNTQQARYNLGLSLHTQEIPQGANRNLTTGATLPCTDAQGQPSSSCTGNADVPPPSSGTSGTSSSSTSGSSTTGAASSSSGSTSTGSGTSSSGAETGTDSSTGTSSSTSGSGGDTTDDGGGGGLTDSGKLPSLAWIGAIFVGAAALALVLVRRRFG